MSFFSFGAFFCWLSSIFPVIFDTARLGVLGKIMSRGVCNIMGADYKLIPDTSTCLVFTQIS